MPHMARRARYDRPVVTGMPQHGRRLGKMMSTAWSCWWLTGCSQCSRQDCIVMSVHAVLQALINRALCCPLLSTHEGDEC